MIHLIEYGDGFKDMKLVPAYVPKDKSLFAVNHAEREIVLHLPFTVGQDEGLSETMYAGIYEYTKGVNQMSLHIYEEETHEEVAVSR